uniref:Polycystin 1, transient receptor potential channel interacting n=1 Tax=Lepisosteus oculatus TaxID=7918 RepID=W5M582_LEPOC|nr:PREDICTED: polycystin-1 [Lepisosteus oculatus]
MPCGNGQTVSKRKHGVCSSLFGLSTSLLLSLCFALTSGMVDSVNHHCPKNCTCSVVGPQSVVNCSNTGLDRVPEATDIPYYTSILDLSKNQISSVDASVFDHLTSLKELYLQGNRLSILPHGILGCRTLSIIDLSNNQISTLEERICDNLFNLSEINLSFNPFVCDCKLFRLVSWIAERGVVVHQPESMQCAKPPEVKNLPLLNVSLSSVICGLNYAACLFDTNTERKELVIFSSSTSGNFTRDSCNAHCFKTGQLYGGLGSKNECLCSTNSEPNFISESQCSAACADNQVMKNCGWTLAKEVFLVDFAASFRQLQAFSVHKEATLSISISVSVSTLSWDFGDLTPLLNTTTTWASHKYALPGRYRVKVTLWSGNKDKTIHTDIDVIVPARLEVKCPTVVTANDSIDVRVWNLGGTDLAVDWRMTGNGNETLRATPYCPPEGLVCSENGHCYHVLRGESPWLEARQQCLSHRSGDLAVVNTPHIRNFLIGHIRNDRGVWVGLSDAGSPGILQWVSGSALEASDDCKREKEAQVSGNTCVSLNSTGQCNTHLCSSKRGFICEFRPHATIPDADVFLEGCAVFSRHWPFEPAATVTVLTNPAREVELLMFPSVWFRNGGRLSALELVIQELKDLVQVRFQVYRPQCTRRDLHLLLPVCGELCVPTAVCYEEEVNITVGSCPAQQQWCHFLSRCLPLSSPCHPSLCSNCSSARSLSSAFTHPNYSLVEEVLFTLPPGKSRHYLVKEGIEDIHVSPGDFIAIQHDAGPGFLISCDRNPSSPWRQSYFTVNHSDWITPSLDNTAPGAWTEDAVCYLRVLYTRKQVVPIESELLKAGLPNQGLYTFQVSAESEALSSQTSCTIQIVPPLSVAVVYPPSQDGTLYLPTNHTFLLVKITSWGRAVARWQGSNQTFPFQETCPTELASAVEACRGNADNSTLFAYMDLDLTAPQESQVVITVENPLSAANLTVKVKVEEPLRGLKIVPNPNQRVLMESLVSYTATVEEGSDVIFKWTVDDKPSFTYYNTVLNVIYQNAAVYKLSVMASNRVSSLTQHYNVTVDRMLKMAGLTVMGVPAIVTQGSAETLSASINVDISVDATVRWCFGDGGYQEYSFKPPYDNSLILPETNAKQVVLQQNVTYTYPQPGEYTLTVSVSNRYENVSQQIHVFVYSILTSVEIQNDTDPLVVGMPAVFEAHPLPSPYGIVYTWNFGDGSPCLQGRERRVNHTFSQSGVYTLSVLANNTISSIGSQMSILVFEEIRGLTASSSGPTELNTPTYINAFVESGNNITWIFDMGDGSVLTSAEPEVEHKYVKDATYVVNITAMNHVNSLSVSLRVQVFVLEVLKLEPSGCIQELLNISFIAFVSGNSSSYVYEWSFGDGSPNRTIHHSPEVAHRFSRSGNYHLSLVLSSSVNKANFFTCVCVQPVVTNVTLLPQSSYTRLGEESEFIVAAFPEFQYTYFWDFGTNDSSVRGTNKMGFTYKSPGRYFVTVTVLNNISFSNNTALVEVQESIGLVVIQHNGTKSNNLALHEVYMFTAFGDYCKAHYTWDFGDGSILMGRNAAHAYNSPGYFNITLTGTNEVSTNSTQITVSVITPIRGLTINASMINVPLNTSVNFDAHLIEGDDVHYSWILCDRCTPIPGSSTIYYTFRSIGTFNVIVTAENRINSMQASIFIFVLRELEGLQILADDLVDGCCFMTNKALHMQATLREGTNMSFSWTILKGQEAILNISGKEAIVNFPEPGVYDVIVKATNLLGQISVIKTIEFLDPVGSVSLKATPNPVAVNAFTNITLLVSGGTNLECLWSTNDNFTLTSKNQSIVHQFKSPGLKFVSVTVANKVSSNTASDWISVQEPISGVTFTPKDVADQQYIASGTTLTLQGNIQTGTNVSWTWHLPNSSEMGRQISYCFPVAVLYTITLNVSNDISWAVTTRNFTVQDKIEGLELKASRNIAAVKENVIFMIGISSGTSVSFHLSISGDSSVLTLNTLNFTHQFTRVDTYVVNLTAQNQVSSERTSTVVTVMEPISRLTMVNCCEQAIPVGVTKMFSAETQSGSRVTYLWTFDLHFGSKTSLIGKEVFYTPPEPGQLIIYLRAVNALGGQNITKVIQAQNILLSAVLEAQPQETLVKKSVLLTAFVLPRPHEGTFLWNFGDSSEKQESNTPSISHSYSHPGVFTVQVNASNFVSFVVAQINVTIQELECEEPEVQLVHSSQVVIKRSQRNYMEATVDLKGCTRYDVEYLWEIYRVSACANLRDTVKVKLHDDLDVRRPQLAIPKMALGVGNYCVVFSLSYKGSPLRKSISLSLSVIPGKLVPIIDGGTFRIWSKSQDLLLNGEKSYDPNLDAENQSPLSYSWDCFLSSKNSPIGCSLHFGSQEPLLVIPEDMLEADMEYTFRLTVSKPGMSPESTNQTVLVKNGRIPMVLLECVSCKAQSVYEVSQSSYVYLAGTCSNCQDNSHTGHWTALNSNNESLVLNMSTTTTGSRGMNLVVRQGILRDGDAYIFTLHVTDPMMDGVGVASIKLRPNLPPAGGSCTLHPHATASALTTKIQFTCTGYEDSDDAETPLVYSLIVTRCVKSYCEEFYVYKGTSSEYSAFVPPGFRSNNFKVDVSVRVEDHQEASTVALNQSMVIRLPEPPQGFQSLTQWLYNQTETALKDLLKQGDPQQVREFSLALITVLNEYEQTGPPSLDLWREREQRVIIRSNITRALVSLDVNTVNDIKQTSAALAQCTTVSKEFICQECQKITLTKLESMLDILQSDTRQGTVTPTEIADNILNIMGDLIHLVNQAPPQPAAEDKFSISNDQLLVASKAYNLSSELMRILMHSRVLNEEPLVFNGSEITTAGKRADPLNLLCYVDDPTCRFSIPESFNTTFKDVPHIVQVLFQVESNPFPFGYVDNYTVSTEVASMEFQTENGTQIPISSLSANKAITVKVSNGKGVKKILSGAANISEWSSVIVMVRTGNTNRAAGLHVQLTFTVLNDAGAVKGTEPYITAYLNSHSRPNEHNCTAQKKITLSLIKGLDHKPYTFFLSPEAYDTTQDYYVNVTNGCRSSPVRLEVGVYSSLCQYFNAGELLWKTDGMVPLEDTTMGRAVCRTEHLTAFGASLFVPPQSVVFIVPEPSPEMSYIVLLTCAVSFVTFSIVAVIVRKLDLIDIKRTGVIPFCGKDGLYKYEVQVKTGWGRGSGTTAHVGISLYGREGRSGHRHLDSGSAFTRSSLDIFHISTDSNLGSIWKIRIWHDNKGLSPSWYVQYVVVKDLQTSNKYFFLIEDWLSVDNDKTEGMVDIEVEASTDTELQRFSRIFVAELERGLSEKHIWLSLWERPARSRFTRLQRATCCFLLVHLFLLANSVWYGLVGDKSRRYTPVSNLTSVSGETLAVGLVTCLIIYPVYLFVLALFRMARSKVCVEQPVPQLDQESLEIDDYLDSSIAGSSFLIFNGIPGETYSEDTNLDVPIASSKSLQKTNFQESVANWPDLLKDPSIMVGHLPKLKRGQGSRHLGVDMTLASEEEEYNNRNKYFTASDEDLIKKILADGQLQMSKLREAQQYFSQTESEMADLSSIFGDKTEVILLQKLNEPVPAGTIRRDPPKSAFTSRTVVTELSKRMLFPYWCSPAAHVLSLLLCVVSSGVSVWIGLRFSSSVALMWLISGIFSFLASFFVLEPLKILAEAFYFSLVVKRVQPEEQDTLVACPRVLHVSERIQKVRPPQGFALFQAREEAKKVRILHRMLTNFLVYMLFLLVVLLINYGDSARDASSRQLQALLQQRLHSATFSSIRKHEDVWLWLSGSLIPYLYNNDTLLKETSSILLGSPRLRQIRAREGCTVEDYFNTGFLLGECKQFASTVDNGTHSIELDRSTSNLTQRWVSSPPDFTGVWYWGKLSIYNNGGYIQELKRSADVSKVILQHLQNFNWLDKMSKALFVEFTLYNTNTDVFAVVTFLVEFSLSAGTLASVDIKAMSLRRLSSGLDLLLLMMVFLLAFAIYFLAREGMAVRREGCRYFAQPWNIAQWCTIALSLSTVVVHLSRVSLADRQWDTFLQHREGFTDFYKFAFQSTVFTELAAVLLFLLILKVSHQLRFLREWSIFGKTLRRAAKDLLAVTVAFVLLLLAYSQLGYLVFSSSAEGYSSVGSAFLSLLGVPQGLLARRPSLPRPSALSLAYLISYGVVQGWLVLRLFPAALLRSYALVRSELYRPAFEPQDYEMVELFLRRLKVWMGLSKTKEFRHKVRFEGMDPLPSRCSSDSKSLCPLPTPDTASDTSSRPSSSSPCGPAEALGPAPPRERAEAEATLRRLPPVFDALLLQLDRVNKVTEDLYQTECRLERAQRRLNRSKCLQVTEALLSKYCLVNRSASAGRGPAGSRGQKPPELRARSPGARPGPRDRESACDADAAIPSSLFRHPAHTTTIPTRKRRPPPMKNKVHPNTDVHVTGHPKMEALSRQGSQL